MERYFIEEAKCGLTGGGIACGPVSENIVVSVKFKGEGDSQWLNLVEVTGIPNYYLTDKDIYDDLIKEDFEDEQFTTMMQESFIDEFDGLSLGEYPDPFYSIADDPDNPAAPLLRYIIALARCPMEEVDHIIAMAKDKYADELDIPMSDVEQDYIEENEEE